MTPPFWNLACNKSALKVDKKAKRVKNQLLNVRLFAFLKSCVFAHSLALPARIESIRAFGLQSLWPLACLLARSLARSFVRLLAGPIDLLRWNLFEINFQTEGLVTFCNILTLYYNDNFIISYQQNNNIPKEIITFKHSHTNKIIIILYYHILFYSLLLFYYHLPLITADY